MEETIWLEDYLIKARKNAIYFKDSKFPNTPLFKESVLIMAFMQAFIQGVRVEL